MHFVHTGGCECIGVELSVDRQPQQSWRLETSARWTSCVEFFLDLHVLKHCPIDEVWKHCTRRMVVCGALWQAKSFGPDVQDRGTTSESNSGNSNNSLEHVFTTGVGSKHVSHHLRFGQEPL